MTKSILVICSILLLGLSTVSAVGLRHYQQSAAPFYPNISYESPENLEYAHYDADQDDDNSYQYYPVAQEVSEAAPVVITKKFSLSGLVSKIEAPLSKVGISISSGSTGVSSSPIQIVSGNAVPVATPKPVVTPQPVATPKPVPTKPADKPTPTKPVDQPAPTKPADKPAPTKPAPTKPAPTKPTKKPTPTKPADKPTPTKPVDQPAPTKPADKPAPTKPTKKPTPTKPADKPAPTKPAPTKPAQNTTDAPKPAANESYYTYPNGSRVPDDQVAALLAQNNTKVDDKANNTQDKPAPAPAKNESKPAANESYYTYPNGTRVPEDQVAGLLAQNNTKVDDKANNAQNKPAPAPAKPAKNESTSTPGESYYTYPNGTRVPDDQVAGLLAQNNTKVSDKKL